MHNFWKNIWIKIRMRMEEKEKEKVKSCWITVFKNNFEKQFSNFCITKICMKI